ncbi:hypothetical protein Pelo_9474 [Pelomyxa schiedti]|nr:hypothetical protein Pelo_9474 [Pelomyxa schiedti]
MPYPSHVDQKQTLFHDVLLATLTPPHSAFGNAYFLSLGIHNLHQKCSLQLCSSTSFTGSLSITIQRAGEIYTIRTWDTYMKVSPKIIAKNKNIIKIFHNSKGEFQGCLPGY